MAVRNAVDPLIPTRGDFDRLLLEKHGPEHTRGAGPRLRRFFGYLTPDDVYEATISRMVTPASTWLDVGCGRCLFPSNEATARILSQRCRLLAGLDPSDNVDENTVVHKRIKTTLEDCDSGEFGLVTLRMVVEHLPDPPAAARALARLVSPGGYAVVYTVHRWAPVTVISRLTPFCLHGRVKRLFWGTEDRDTFPTFYRMNTRRQLARAFVTAGFRERYFATLDDCRTLAKWGVLNAAELTLWKLLRMAGLNYPERCVLGIYQKNVE